MEHKVILASGSEIRAKLLTQACVPFSINVPRIDEQIVKESLVAEEARPRDIADALAEMKARKVRSDTAFVIGCDQVLDFKGEIVSKPNSPTDAVEQLRRMRGQSHALYSAAVIYSENEPVWRHVGHVRLHMRTVSDEFIERYVDRNWESIQHSVGAYKLEEEGVRLFHSVQGDYFHVLGMPLLEILSFLSLRGVLET